MSRNVPLLDRGRATERPRTGLLWAAVGLLASCAGAPVSGDDAFQAAREAVTAPDAEDTAARRAAAAEALEQILEQGSESDPARRSEHFWASYFLAQLHAAAADEPFLIETSTRREHLGSLRIGVERRAALDEGQRYSHTAHLVAALDHAGRARRILATYEEVPPPPPVRTAGGEPAPAGREALGTNLALLMATSYARLGFRREVSLALEEAPRLLVPQTCLAFMEEFEVRAELRPWVCEMVSNHLRDTDELTAYRFAVMAIEGRERFGQELPPAVVERLEGWILNGANMRFVCPRSQTAYIPGRERSPLSGIRHFEYVAVAR